MRLLLVPGAATWWFAPSLRGQQIRESCIIMPYLLFCTISLRVWHPLAYLYGEDQLLCRRMFILKLLDLLLCQ
jgi:hypothetical protein